MNTVFFKSKKGVNIIIPVVLIALVFGFHKNVNAQYIDGVNPIAGKVIELLKTASSTELLGMMDENMKSKIPDGQLTELWSGLQSQMGAFQGMSKYMLTQSGEFSVITQICKFEKMDLALQLSLNKDGYIQGMFFIPPPAEKFTAAPAYADPKAFVEKEVVFDMGDIKLPGYYTYPVDKRSFPVVVLVHGSGAHDADETIGPNKIFRDVAQGLASKGIGVVRYEKRNKNNAHTLDPQNITPREELLDDFGKVLKAVMSFDGVDKDQLYMMGHSLGGYFAPLMAKEHPELKGVIVMAGNASPLHKIVMDQMRYLIPMQVNDTIEQRKIIDGYQIQSDRIESGDYNLEVPHEEMMLSLSAAYWKFVSNYNPVEMMNSLPQRVLVVHGERDYQVPVSEHEKWKKGLEGKKNARVLLFKGLNHPFMYGDKPSVPADYFVEGNVSEELIKTVESWIREKK